MSVQTGHLAVDETIPSGIRLCAYPPAEKVDVLIADDTEETFRKESAELLLQPKNIFWAWAARRIRTAQSWIYFEKILEEQGIVIEQIAALASIDVKKRNDACWNSVKIQDTI